MLQFDHLTVIAPSLAEGVEHARACLDLDLPFGRRHVDMGTYNHLLRLGDGVYLEVIAVDPEAPPPAGPRWFGLGDADAVRAAWERGARLRGWIARTDDIDAVIGAHGEVFGRKTRLSSADSFFYFSIPADGALPLGGLAPSVIDRRGRPPSTAAMPDLGAQLEAVFIEHPEPAAVAAFYGTLGLDRAPLPIEGDSLRYRALIGTPGGIKTLT